MKALVQRVRWARVEVEGQVVGAIEAGLLVLLGVAPADGTAEMERLGQKLLQLRIFHDEAGKMNRSVTETGGGLLVVSQFTLFADTRKGNRPSFTGAAPPDQARALYEAFVAYVRAQYPTGRIETGQFAAHMAVSLLNDGPVTLLLDTDTWNPTS